MFRTSPWEQEHRIKWVCDVSPSAYAVARNLQAKQSQSAMDNTNRPTQSSKGDGMGAAVSRGREKEGGGLEGEGMAGLSNAGSRHCHSPVPVNSLLRVLSKTQQPPGPAKASLSACQLDAAAKPTRKAKQACTHAGSPAPQPLASAASPSACTAPTRMALPWPLNARVRPAR